MAKLKTMVKKRRKIKVNNSGMSLVEVIIAITILGIVAVPVLHSLTTAMVYNSKARIRQDMTLKAESIMETFKGYDVETLQGMFAANSGIDGIVAGTDCDGYTAPAFDFSLGVPPDVPLQYGIIGLKDARDRRYDVTITATPKGKQTVLEMENIDGAKDAIYKGDRNYDKKAAGEALKDFRTDTNKQMFVDYMSSAPFEEGESGQALNADGNNISETDVDADAFANYIDLHERRIKFTILDDGSGNYVVTAKMTYQYCVRNYPYYSPERTEPKTDPFLGEGETETAPPEMEHFPSQLFYLDKYPAGDGVYLEVTIPMDGNAPEPEIYKQSTGTGLNRLVVYYYPQYDLGGGHDIIEIENKAGIDRLYCYVIKQRAADINETRTGVFEQGYSAKVEGRQGTGTVFNLYHNFGENIGGGSSTATPAISGFTASADYTSAAEFYKEEVLLYDLMLEVRDTVTGNVITTFESSKNERIK